MKKPLSFVEISRKNLLDNYHYLSKKSGFPIAPVLKGNAYGHGLIEVARILEKENPPFFCLDSFYESNLLFEAGFKTPILIMGYVDPSDLKGKSLPFSYAVWDIDQIKQILKYQSGAKFHIFVDTGMHREGVRMEDLPSFLSSIKAYSDKIEGLMSHFGVAGDKKYQPTGEQIENFQKAQDVFSKFGISPKWVHINATAGNLHLRKIGNLGRAGIGIYGFDPEEKDKSLKPVLKLKSTITQIKKVKKGEELGYSFTFKAKKDMRIGVIPLGYSNALSRSLSNRGIVKVEGHFCPIVGRVNMGMTTIDLANTSAKLGDEVLVYSDAPKDKNSVSNVAKMCGTIPYEIVTAISASIPRIVL